MKKKLLSIGRQKWRGVLAIVMVVAILIAVFVSLSLTLRVVLIDQTTHWT